MELTPDLKDTFTTEGKVKIHFESHGSDKIRLHAKELIIDESSILISDLDGNQVNKVIGHEYDLDRELYVIHLETALTKNSNFTLDIDFTSVLSDNLSGKNFMSSLNQNIYGNRVKCIVA